jgi:hypothetical protein
MKTLVSKLRSSPAQAALFDETLKTCRRLSNHTLAERKTAYQERGKTLAFARQCATLPQLKQTWHDVKRIHSQVLQDVLHRLQHAFDGFFRRLKAGQTPGYPRAFAARAGTTASPSASGATGLPWSADGSSCPKSVPFAWCATDPCRAHRKPARLCGRRTVGMPTSPARCHLRPCHQRGKPWAWMSGWSASRRSPTGHRLPAHACIALPSGS